MNHKRFFFLALFTQILHDIGILRITKKDFGKPWFLMLLDKSDLSL